MKESISLVIVSTLMLGAWSAYAQSKQEPRNQSAVIDHAVQQQDETPEALPEEKLQAGNTGPHGGESQQVSDLEVETLIEPGGLRLFITDRSRKSLDLSGARVSPLCKLKELQSDTATIYFLTWGKMTKQNRWR